MFILGVEIVWVKAGKSKGSLNDTGCWNRPICRIHIVRKCAVCSGMQTRKIYQDTGSGK